MNRRSAAVLLLLAFLAATPARAAIVLVVRAHVTDASGHACGSLPLAVSGVQAAIASTTGDDGRTLLPLVLGTRAELARAPVVVRLRAESRSMHLETRSGAPEITLSFGIPQDDSTVLQIITTGEEAGSAIAGAFRAATGDTVEAALELRCAKGPGRADRPIALDYSGRVPFPRRGAPATMMPNPPVGSRVAPEPAPARTGPTTPAPRAPRSRPRGKAAPSPPIAEPPPTRRDTLPVPVPAPEAACRCRMVGTVEVQSDRAIEERLHVIVSVHEQPAFADTVELFMGSPRPFRLTGVPCGDLHLDVTPLSRKYYPVLTPLPDHPLECRADMLLQPRVILGTPERARSRRNRN